MKFPFVVTEEQARVIRRRWLKCAFSELLAWGICFPVLYTLADEFSKGFTWVGWWKLAFTGVTLVLFCRVALWAALLGGLALFFGGGLVHWPELTLAGFWTFFAALASVIIRSPFFLWFMADTAQEVAHVASEPNAFHSVLTPVDYDPSTDEHIFADGRREPARIRWPYGKPKQGNDSL